ncbi:MAG: hypothetical protein K8M05_17165 [Deltaproteobacteria bacterium]|nr:hypothetical protein [Kofleriaceae bacterium]
MMRTRLAVATCTFVLLAAAVAVAQPARKPPPRPPQRPAPKVVPKIVKAPPPAPLVGLTPLGAFSPARGFLDDVVTDDGTHLGVVVTDGDQHVEIQVLGMADAGEVARVDVKPMTEAVRRFYLLGDKLFVVPRRAEGVPEDAPITPFFVGLDGQPLKRAPRLRPATDFFVRPFAGQQAIIAYTRDPGYRKGLLHQVEAFDLAKGKKLGKKSGRLVVGKDGRDATLDFTPHYFLDDMTVVVGTRGGVWRKKEDQRSPDTHAAWDLLTATWVKDEPITDLVGRARKLEIMAEHPHRLFARMKEDNSTVEVWRDGVASGLTLDQPLELYVAASLAYAVRGDKLWLSLQIDPVNPPAVARKKADPEYLDLFEVDGDRAVRKARIHAPKKKLRWGWVGDTLWVMEKNVGFDRGSKLITLYKPS